MAPVRHDDERYAILAHKMTLFGTSVGYSYRQSLIFMGYNWVLLQTLRQMTFQDERVLRGPLQYAI